MIILKKIKLNNFLSHTNTEIDLADEQKLLLDGNSGSGKSSIVEAIIWGLYGKGRVDNRYLVKKKKKEASVTIVLGDTEDENISYRIKRSISTKGKHNLEVEETNDKGEYTPIKETGIKNIQHHLEKYILRSSYLLFINSIAYPQENNDAFVKQTAKKRKDIIMEMIQAEDYEEYLKMTKDMLYNIKIKVESLNNQVKDKEQRIEENKQNMGDLEKMEKEKEDAERSLDEKQKEIDALTEERNEKSEKLSNLSVKKETLEKLQKEEEECYNNIQNLEGKIENIQATDIKQLEENVNKLQEVEKELKEGEQKREEYYKWLEEYNNYEKLKPSPPAKGYQEKIDELNQKIIKIMKEEKTPTCPQCGTKYPEFEEDKQRRIKELEVELENTDKERHNYEQQITEINDKLQELMQKKPVYSEAKIAELQQTKNSLADAEKKLYEAQNNLKLKEELEQQLKQEQVKKKDIEKQKHKLNSELKEENELTQEKEKMDKMIEQEKEKLNGIQTEVQNLQLSISQAQKAKKEKERLEKEVEDINEKIDSTNYDIKCLESLKEAFSPNGIRTIVIDYMIPQLEERINNILEKLSDFRVRLETQKEGVSGNTVLEGLFISIINDVGEEFDFSSYSGGEKVKISLAINEALAEISKINFRIMDEAVVALDNESTYQFVESLSDIQSKVNQIICISHLPEIKEMFEDKISFKKIKGNTVKV